MLPVRSVNPATLRASFALTVLLFVCPLLRADICTSQGNGNWASASTWDCGHAPAAGDMMIIAAGHTVNVTANITYTGAAMRIRIYGTLNFNGGGSKLSLPAAPSWSS